MAFRLRQGCTACDNSEGYQLNGSFQLTRRVIIVELKRVSWISPQQTHNKAPRAGARLQSREADRAHPSVIRAGSDFEGGNLRLTVHRSHWRISLFENTIEPRREMCEGGRQVGLSVLTETATTRMVSYRRRLSSGSRSLVLEPPYSLVIRDNISDTTGRASSMLEIRN